MRGRFTAYGGSVPESYMREYDLLIVFLFCAQLSIGGEGQETRGLATDSYY